MANTRELRRKIRSIKSTAQITKAMQMVAATKMRRAQAQALNGRPYNLNLNAALERLLPLINKDSHPLLRSNEAKTLGIVLLTTNKSLCGALNTNVFRLIIAADLISPEISYYTIGKKGRNFVARAGGNLVADFENRDVVTFREAVQLARLLTESFLKGEIGEVYLIYPGFISTLRQEPVRKKILPIDLGFVIASQFTLSVVEGWQSSKFGESEQSGKIATVVTLPRDDNGNEFIFEPDTAALLEYILLHYLQVTIYQSLLETKASEHSARMIAMQNATDNALELVSDLNLAYNQTRQDSITKELLEITTAAVAMQ